MPPFRAAALVCASAVQGAVAQHVVQVPPSCSDCNAALQTAIDDCASFTAAAAAKWCTVELQAGTYRIPAQGGLAIRNAANVAFAGAGDGDGGTELLMSGDAWKMTLLSVTDSRNVTLSGFSVEMARPSYTYCKATKVEGSATECSFDPAAYKFSSDAASAWQYEARCILEYDPATRHEPPGGVDIYATDGHIKVSVPQSGVMRLDPANLPVGRWYIVRHVTYGGAAFPSSTVNGLTVSDVTMWSGPGMGVVSHNSTDITLRRFNTRRKGDRPMSISADATHFSSNRGGRLVLDGCVFEGQGDDGLNIDSGYQAIDTISADRLTLTLTGRSGDAAKPNFLVGDGVKVYDRYTFNLRATTGVAAVTSTSVTVTDALPSSVQQYDLVENIALQTDSVLLRDCVFTKNRARGALLKANNVLAINNTFDHTTGPCIQAYPDGCTWYEGNTFSNWTLDGNSFAGCNFAAGRRESDIFVAAEVPAAKGDPPTCNDGSGKPSTAAAFHDLTLRGNTWEMGHDGLAFAAYGVVGLVVDSNTVTTGKASTAWECVQATADCASSWVPLRCYQGAKECLATDGTNCWWRSDRAACEDVLNNLPSDIPEPTGVYPGNCVDITCPSRPSNRTWQRAGASCRGCAEAHFAAGRCSSVGEVGCVEQRPLACPATELHGLTAANFKCHGCTGTSFTGNRCGVAGSWGECAVEN